MTVIRKTSLVNGNVATSTEQVEKLRTKLTLNTYIIPQVIEKILP